ncbi:MAG: copper chaperone PCu(A)C [Emcibacter sp.]|nr:copper chaperone PCu(A)C [Emcibacter sp.]
MKILGAIFFLLSFLQFGYADDSGLSVKDAWTRPVIIEGRPSALYFTLHNNTDNADKLIKAVSLLANSIELHVHKQENGIMTMEQVDDIPIPAHETVMVEPGGFHLMVFGLTQKLAVGDEFPLVLTFTNAGNITVVAKVMKNAPVMEHDHMDHKN